MSEREHMYVIYRPLPAALLTLVLAVAGGLAGLVVGAGAGAAWGQRDPGPGVWNTTNTQTINGTIVADPYPMLLPSDGSAGVLLVGVGKVGPPQDVRDAVGMVASITGYLLERNGLRTLEVQSVEAKESASTPARPVLDLGTAVITGEILDSKCYLGAMKPGNGTGHRACAILCIEGGIPPMLAWRDSLGKMQYALVVGADNTPMNTQHLQHVGHLTNITGALHSRDGWLWIEPD